MALRTLKTFEEKGMVRQINDGTRSVKYARCVDDCFTNEHHIYNNEQK